MKKALLLFNIIFALPSVLWAGSVKGIIVDEYAEPLVGATIIKEGTTIGAYTNLDGTYTIKDLPVGKHKLIISYIGYKGKDTVVNITSAEQVLVLNVRLYSMHHEFTGVEVVASVDKESDQSARKSEQNAENVINVVSAKSILVSPDITVANVMQRVSGVSIERNNNGDGQYAIVRGMDKRYNYTLVNGIKIPSPDNKNRYVPLDIFPADLLERLVVAKALTPSMEGDAIGGVVNMVLKDAPDGFFVQANVATGYSQMFFDRKFKTFDRSVINSKSPAERNGKSYNATPSDFPNGNANFNDINPAPNAVIGFSMGNRLLKSKKLGVIVAASYQNTYRGSNSVFFMTEVNRNDNSPSLENIQGREYSAQQVRSGVHFKADYEFNKNHKINFYNAYINLTLNEARYLTDTNLVLGRVGVGTGRVTNHYRSRHEVQQIYNSTLQGEHTFSQYIRGQWSAVYSIAKLNEPDRVELDLSTGVTKNPDGTLKQEPTYFDNGTYRRWSHNFDQDQAGYVNIYITPLKDKKKLEVAVGGLYRHKTRENYYNNYTLRPTGNTVQTYNGDVANDTFMVFNPKGSTSDPLNYNSHENVAAGYLQGTVNIKNLQILGGVRIEHTDFGWVTQGPATLPGKVGSLSYLDVLPSVHFKYKPSPNKNIRASYFASLSRPGFFEVVPYILNYETYDEKGNPFLKRVQANNFDVRYEYFPRALDQVLIGAFYKQIINPIEYALEVSGVNMYYTPGNFGTATNYGFEFDLVKYFKKFGIKTNYTYTSSSITTNKTVRYRDANNNLTEKIEQQTRPLQGQSKHVGNLSFLYKDSRKGIDAQIALVYTGRRLVTVSPFKDNDQWQRSTVQMDISTEKRLKKHFYFYVKVNNVLNTPYLVEIPIKNSTFNESIPYQTSGNTLVRRDYYHQTYLIGIRYKFSN